MPPWLPWPPILRFRLQLALLAMAMAAAPCSCPDEAFDADLHFAMYAGGLDGFGQEPSLPLEDVGIQQGHQRMFLFNENPDFAIQEHSYLSPNEARSVTTANHDVLHPNLVCPLQDHTGILHGVKNHNLSPVQGYSFPQYVNAAPHNGRSHAKHPFSTDASSQLVHRNNQNNLIPVQEQTSLTVLHDAGHDTLPVKGESDTFHEIFEVIDSPGLGYDTLDPRQIHHNAFKTQEPLENPVTSIQNVQGIDSVRLFSSEFPQENTGHAQFVQGQEQMFPVADLAQSPAAYEQRTPPVPSCTSARQAATVHDFGGDNPVYSVSGIDTGQAMSPIPISNAQIFDDNLTNTLLEIHSQRFRKVIPSIRIPFLKDRDHRIHCSGNVANNRQHLFHENLEMGFQEVNSYSKTRLNQPSSADESMDHQKQENNLSSIENNKSYQGTFLSFPAHHTNSQTSMQNAANIQQETQNILKHQSLTCRSITNNPNKVQPPITIKLERVTDVKLPQESYEQLRTTNYKIQPLVHHQDGAQESPRSVQTQSQFHHPAGVQESPRNVQTQSQFHNQAGVQESPRSVQSQLIVRHLAGSQESTRSVPVQPLCHNEADVQESPGNVQTQSQFQHQAGVQESPRSVQSQLLVRHLAGSQESTRSVPVQPLCHNEADVQESPSNVQTQSKFQHQAGVQESPRSVQTQSQFHHQAGVQESPRSVQSQLLVRHLAGSQESTRSVPVQPLCHNEADVQESPSNVQTQSKFQHQAGVQESPRSVQNESQLHNQAGVQDSPRSVQSQLLVRHLAGVQESPSVTWPEIITRSKNDFQQRSILPKIHSIFNKDPNYLPSLKSSVGTREKVMAYEKASRSNVQKPAPKTPATYVPAVTRDIPRKPLVAEIPLSPRAPVQAPGNSLLVRPEEFILPPTLSEIPYDAFPYSESTDAEEKPTYVERTQEDARCAVSNATKLTDDTGASGTDAVRRDNSSEAVLIAPKVIEDVQLGNVTKSDKRSKLKKKAKRRYEATENNRTATGQEKSVAVTTVSRLGATGGGGGGDSGSAVQLCQCEPGKGCSCQSCSSCVKDLCRTVGLRVAEDVGEFVKKEAVSVLKTLRDLKI